MWVFVIHSIELIKSGDNFFQSKTVLTYSYKDGTFSLDIKPNPYLLTPTVNFFKEIKFTKRWLQGDKYSHISTQGAAGLDQVSVFLMLTQKEY